MRGGPVGACQRKPVVDLAMPVLRTGPDQMLRQPTLTAERTMTRAGDVNGGLDRGAAIRERPLQGKGKHQECRDA